MVVDVGGGVQVLCLSELVVVATIGISWSKLSTVVIGGGQWRAMVTSGNHNESEVED